MSSARTIAQCGFVLRQQVEEEIKVLLLVTATSASGKGTLRKSEVPDAWVGDDLRPGGDPGMTVFLTTADDSIAMVMRCRERNHPANVDAGDEN